MSDDEDEAGLTSKPHRDRPAPERLRSTVLRGPFRLRLASASRPGPACSWRPGGATTDPDGLHRATVGHDRSPRNRRVPNPLPRRRRGGRRRRTVSPLASSARCASRAVAPVVSTSSQTTTSASGVRRASRRRARLGQAIEPARLAALAAASSPAWSSTRTRSRSRRTARTSCPARRSRAAAPRVMVQVGSWPRARTVAGRDGTGVSTTGRPLVPASSTAPRTALASRSDSGPRSPCMASLLVAEHQGTGHVGVLGGRPRRDQTRRDRRGPAPGRAGASRAARAEAAPDGGTRRRASRAAGRPRRRRAPRAPVDRSTVRRVLGQPGRPACGGPQPA